MLLCLARAGGCIRIVAIVPYIHWQPDLAFPCGTSVALALGEVLHAHVKGTLQKVVTRFIDALVPTGDAAALLGGH